VDNGYVAASMGLKCFKDASRKNQKKKTKKKKKYIFQKKIHVPWDPHIAVGEYGYVAALVGLKCLKGKKKKKKISKKISSSVGPTHSHQGRWLCCSFVGIEMFQGNFLFFIFLKINF
jgi:hypothetical protein